MDLDLFANLERIDRMLLRHQKLQPAGTKRKLPEPRTSPSFSSLRSTSPLEMAERAEKFQAFIRSERENIRKLDDDEAFSDLDGDDDEHNMEQD
jgi:hypothetical protein